VCSGVVDWNHQVSEVQRERVRIGLWELDGIQWAGTHVVRSDVCATLGYSALVDVAIEVA